VFLINSPNFVFLTKFLCVHVPATHGHILYQRTFSIVVQPLFCALEHPHFFAWLYAINGAAQPRDYTISRNGHVRSLSGRL
jgi:hypothetical protein